MVARRIYNREAVRAVLHDKAGDNLVVVLKTTLLGQSELERNVFRLNHYTEINNKFDKFCAVLPFNANKLWPNLSAFIKQDVTF